MRIVEVRLSGFGRFTDLALSFPENFKVILGSNEAGKSTVVDAITGVLFGFRRGQKNLRERYKPWHSTQYSASLVLHDEDDVRYLIGRDFEHDRLELFRGQGVRLAPLSENDLEQILQDGLGITTPQLFESTLLIRQPESSLVVRDRRAASRLAEALGRKISGGDDNAPYSQALRAIQDKLAEIDAPGLSGSLSELEAELARRERDFAQIDQGHARYATLLEERDRLRSGLATFESELSEMKTEVHDDRAAMVDAENRNRVLGELAEVQRLLNGMARDEAGLSGAADDRSPAPVAPGVIARAEELARHLSGVEVERRYQEEGTRQYRAEVDLLEQEIAATKAKLSLLDPHLLSAEVQSRLAHLLPIVHENTARLGDLFPRVDSLLERLRRLRIYRLVSFSSAFVTTGGAAIASGFLPRFHAWSVCAFAGVLTASTGLFLFWSARLRVSASRMDTEIERREADLRERRMEMDRILQGKTPSQFQAELEASRVYQKDLWDLEQMLAQKQQTAGEHDSRPGRGRPSGYSAGIGRHPELRRLPRFRTTACPGRTTAGREEGTGGR